jgi:hypothetical protein
VGKGEGDDELVDDDGELVDLGIERVDLPQQSSRDRGMVVVETAGQCFHERGAFDP